MELINKCVIDPLKPKIWKGQPVGWYQSKLDGHRLVVQHTDVSGVRAFTRVHDITAKLDAAPRGAWRWWEFLKSNLPPNSVIDGEMHVPGAQATEVPRALVAHSSLSFAPFAVPVWEGFDASAWALDNVADITRAVFRCEYEMPAYREWTPKHTPEYLISYAKDIGSEGFMLKDANYHSWYKVKVVSTLDLRVSGIKPGKGKYEGVVGALILVDGTGHEVAACSGMTDAERAEMGINDVGRICEVEYQEIAAEGRLRHPRFVRWRDDKAVADCLDSTGDCQTVQD